MIATGADLADARQALGMSVFELGFALRLEGGRKKAGDRVREMERGVRPVSGPVAVAVEAMLKGFFPDDFVPERQTA